MTEEWNGHKREREGEGENSNTSQKNFLNITNSESFFFNDSKRKCIVKCGFCVRQE